MGIFSRLSQIARPFRGTLIAAFVLVMVSTLLDTAVITFLFTAMIFVVIGEKGAAAQGIVVKKMLGFDLGHLLKWLVADNDPFRLLLILAAITALTVFLKSVSDSRNGFLMNKFANLVGREMRQRLFNHMLRLSPAHFERETTGAHLSRITGDVPVLQQCMGPQFAEILHAPLTILIALAYMFAINWWLTLTALCLAPLIAVVMAVGGRLIRKLVIRNQERLSDFNSVLVERLGNVRIIQSFIREPYETARVAQSNADYYRSTIRSVLVMEIVSPGIVFIAFLGMIAGIITGGWAVLHAQMDSQQFVLFLMLAQKAGSQFKGLSRLNQVRQQASGAASRIFELLDEEPEIKDAPDACVMPALTGHIVFDRVSFRYAAGDEVLREIVLDVQPGEIIALVGPSGSGKTTLVNLLPRFYDPTGGRILVDGVDLRAITLASLRGQIGIVPQETALFSGSIRENIRYGKLDADDDEVSAAALAANALEFIERLPEGFDTVVGERGARLSGGQRQRVAIARALLKNPRILILDEATSALDTESEHLVQQALERLMEGRTTFVIAHRLSTVQHATRILVLQHGRIVESGTHEQLLARAGLYQRLYEMQFHATPDADEVG